MLSYVGAAPNSQGAGSERPSEFDKDAIQFDTIAKAHRLELPNLSNGEIGEDMSLARTGVPAKKWLFTAIGSIVARLGLHLSRRTSEIEMGKVLQKLQPSSGEKNLIRVGGSGDGGYWIPNDLEDIEAVFSPGVGKLSEFELFFAERDVPCFMVDASVEGPAQDHPNFHFQPVWLAKETTPGKTISLEDWLDSSAPAGDLILQMDIEGGEYPVLLTAEDFLLARFRIIALELHNVTSITSQSGLQLVESLLTRLLKTHEIVHSNHNPTCRTITVGRVLIPNCVELTFRRSRVSDKSRRDEVVV